MGFECRRAKAAAAARGETRLPPPKVNCTYDWSSLGEADPESKGFFSRFRLKPLLEKKNSGRPILRSELATMGILGTGRGIFLLREMRGLLVIFGSCEWKLSKVQVSSVQLQPTALGVMQDGPCRHAVEAADHAHAHASVDSRARVRCELEGS